MLVAKNKWSLIIETKVIGGKAVDTKMYCNVFGMQEIIKKVYI